MMNKIKFMLLSIMTVFMASCSHDFEPMQYPEQVYATYAFAFEKALGTPDKNQTWGFGSVSNARVTRSIESSYNFPSDADASKFLSDVPEGVEYYGDLNWGGGYASGVSYIDENMTRDVNIWGQGTAENGWKAYGGTLYVKGNCDFSSRKFYFAGNGSQLYLVAGATLTLSADNAANLQEGTMIYVAEGAKIVANGELKLNKGLHIYNHGTIEAAQISTNESSVLYNVGTVNVKGKISVENGESVIVNDGTLTASDLNTAGSGKIQNNGDATITGTTIINSNTNTWVNNGQYETGDFRFTAGSSDVINNCKLTVNKEFLINLGDCDYGVGFYVDGGVVASSFKMEGPGYIYLASNSVFKVSGDATMGCKKANYGIYGIGDEWAVFQADNIVAGADNQEYLVTYGGKLAVVTNSHFAQSTEGRPYYDVKEGVVLSTEANVPEINIPESECNPGFVNKGTEVTPDPEEPNIPETPSGNELDGFTFLCRVFAEDLSASQKTDFDFNDVVFDVYTNGTDAKIKLLAAGGTLPLTVAGKEVHEAFGGYPVGTMINTGAGPEVEAVVLDVVIPGVNTVAQVKDIPVCVFKNEIACLLTADMGKAPAKFAVTEQIEWPAEYQGIESKYPNFKSWVTTSTPARWW